MQIRMQLIFPIVVSLTITALILLAAFQDQKALPLEIREMAQQMEIHKMEYQIDSALYFAEMAKIACEKAGMEEKAIEFINHKFIILSMDDQMDLEDYLAAVEAEWKPEFSNKAQFLQYYYGAKCSYFLLSEQIDSVGVYYNQATQNAEKTKKWDDLIELSVFIAQVYFEFGDYFGAQDYIQKSEELIQKELLPQGEDFPLFYAIHSVIVQEMGDYEAALKSALKSVEYLREDENVHPLDLAYEYNNLGAIYNAMEDYSNAEKYYLQALDITNSLNQDNEIINSLNNISFSYLKKEDYGKALNFLRRSKAILASSDENSLASSDENSLSKEEVNCYHLIIDVFFKLEKLDSVEYYLKTLNNIHRKTAYKIERTYEKMGRIFLKNGKYDKALNYFEKLLAIDLENYGNKHPQVSYDIKNLGDVFFDSKKYIKSVLAFQKALVANSIIFEASTDWHKNPSVDNVIDKSFMLNILSQKIKALKALYEAKEADVSLEDIYVTALLATEVLSELNKKVMNEEAKRFWLNKEAVPIYEQAIGLALQLAEKTGKEEYVDQAFQLSERSKSVLLTGALQETSAGAFGGVPDTLIQRKQSLERLIGNTEKKKFDALLQQNEVLAKRFEQKVFQLEHELDVLKRELEVNYPKYYKLKYEDKVADLASIRAELDENTVFIEYFEGFDQVHVFVLRKDKSTFFSVKIDGDFQRGVMNYQNQLADVSSAVDEPMKSYNNYISKSYELYEQLLAPAMKEVKENERIVIITDGTLGYIPFESLLTEKVPVLEDERQMPKYANLPYLLNKNRVSYNYSGTLWLSQLAQETEVVNGNILAMAPIYGNAVKVDSTASKERSPKEMSIRESLTELPGAAAEIDLLQSKYAGAFYKGVDASEQTIKAEAENYGILHLAMHGLVDEKTPEFSSLAMTEDGNPKDDNFFYAYEIKQLNLKAGLVVLSACETGAGKYQRGEGVVSLGRGFMYAGAPSLIMTLWSLNDQSALLLIEYFYENLAVGMEKDEALQQAKIKYLSEADGIAAHPALWACFIQLGNYSSIKIETKKPFSIPWILGGVGMVFAAGFGAQRVFKKRAA